MNLYQITDIRLNLTESEESLKQKLANILNVTCQDFDQFFITKQSIDARKKSDVHYKINIAFSLKNNKMVKNERVSEFTKIKELEIEKKETLHSPIIVGSGPSGLFCALILARASLKPIVLEMGKNAINRQLDVEAFWAGKQLNTKSNVQFGHGGAGTFSDGKLNSGIKSIYSSFVLHEFVKHGANSNIEYSNSPHVGTDILINVINSMQKEIESLGGKILYEHEFIGFNLNSNKLCEVDVKNNGVIKIFKTSHLILCIGHSSRNTFELLYRKNIQLAQKPFSIGVRIEHLQEIINKSQYGKFYKLLPPANYKLSCHLDSKRSVYTFCMCPGGYVVNASSEENGVVCNGMSYNSRNGKNANSALLINVELSDFASSHPLAGIYFQREWEQKAYNSSSSHKLPVQKVADFLKNKTTTTLGNIVPQTKGQTVFANLNNCLPEFVTKSLKQALPIFENKIKGFSNPDAILTGIETRSSCPVRIVRNETHETNLQGIYVCGEGAGYAGGIMSASIDGLKTALIIINSL